jgi:hypothetical protein
MHSFTHIIVGVVHGLHLVELALLLGTSLLNDCAWESRGHGEHKVSGRTASPGRHEGAEGPTHLFFLVIVKAPGGDPVASVALLVEAFHLVLVNEVLRGSLVGGFGATLAGPGATAGRHGCVLL